MWSQVGFQFASELVFLVKDVPNVVHKYLGVCLNDEVAAIQKA